MKMTQKSRFYLTFLVLCLLGLLPLASLVKRLDHSLIPMAAITLSLLLGIFYFGVVRERWKNFVQPLFRTQVLIQASVQSSLLYYISCFDPQLGIFFPYIIYFIFFGYACEIFLLLLTNKKVVLGLYIFPLILSINLFLSFAPTHYPVMYFLVTVGVLAKNYLVYKNRPGWDHIFNPSAITLSVLLIISLMVPSIRHAVDVKGLYHIPFFDLALVTLASFTLWLPNSYWIPIGGAVTLILAERFSLAVFGMPWMFGNGRGQILLAFCLLITDPKTSPRTNFGKFFFGVTYALGLSFFYYLLMAVFGEFSDYNKILAAPFFNLLAPYYDTVLAPVTKWFEKIKWPTKKIVAERAFGLLIFAGGFLLVFTEYETHRPAPYLLEQYPVVKLSPLAVRLEQMKVRDFSEECGPIWQAEGNGLQSFGEMISLFRSKH